jgi:hypothetical protein
LALRRKQRDVRLGPGDAQLDPTLPPFEWLVSHQLESELLRIEFERFVLIADGDAHEANHLDHGCLLRKSDSGILALNRSVDNSAVDSIELIAIANSRITIDRHVVEVLMRDLVGHDKKASTFVVYFYLYVRRLDSANARVRISLQRLADSTGLSKRAVQIAIKHLVQRQLLDAYRATPTSVPEYSVRRPWAAYGRGAFKR